MSQTLTIEDINLAPSQMVAIATVSFFLTKYKYYGKIVKFHHSQPRIHLIQESHRYFKFEVVRMDLESIQLLYNNYLILFSEGNPEAYHFKMRNTDNTSHYLWFEARNQREFMIEIHDGKAERKYYSELVNSHTIKITYDLQDSTKQEVVFEDFSEY